MSASGAKSADPTFPEDLERCIFESAALFHPDCIPALLLVAHRVKIWQVPFVQFGFYVLKNVVFRIEPLFYKVVTIYGPPSRKVPKPNTIFRHSVPAFYSFMKSKPASFFPDNVRHIQLVGIPIAEILKALAACNATINLALFDVSSLSARRNYWLNPDSPKWDFAHPLFAQITHLDLPGNHGEQWADWSLLTSIPRLTHLSFSDDFLSGRSLFNVILEHCKSLQVLAMLFADLPMYKYIALLLRGEYPHYPDFDPRVIFLVVGDRQTDWEAGARGGNDYWIAAEGLVEKHRGGDFDGAFPRLALSPLTDHFVISQTSCRGMLPRLKRKSYSQEIRFVRLPDARLLRRDISSECQRPWSGILNLVERQRSSGKVFAADWRPVRV
ncbi:hypothetical protein B0H13DRAFT_1870678 [Mycena leptocephala]|nr:hypothetical protein B0H13DRAFT_1870678 [Mycena leptocephala]